MINTPSVFRAQIYHKRLFPKINRFSYRLTYLALPLSNLDRISFWPFFSVNRPSIMSFWAADHGLRENADLRIWVRALLSNNGLGDVDGEIVLITLPRLFGYVFNPVSFWVCYRKTGELGAVIAEVNNTFGETHSYVCAADDTNSVQPQDSFYADKEFHVSPFLDRTGYYRFKFDMQRRDFLSVNIDYFDEDNRLQLRTSIGGTHAPMTLASLLKGWISSPLMAIKAISLIHWQAVKLVFKSATYKPKPEQHRWYQTRARKHRSFSREESHQHQPETTHVFEPH